MHSRDFELQHLPCMLEPASTGPGGVAALVLAELGTNGAALRHVVHELLICMLDMPENGTARCVLPTIDSQRQLQDLVLRLQGMENRRFAPIIPFFSAFSDYFLMRDKTVWTAEVSLVRQDAAHSIIHD
ncbi:hypothetical protein MAN_08908, partial [Metarhizium hybridum]